MNNYSGILEMFQEYKTMPQLQKSSKFKLIKQVLRDLQEVPDEIILIYDNYSQSTEWTDKALAILILQVLVYLISYKKETLRLNCQVLIGKFLEMSFMFLSFNDKRVQDDTIKLIGQIQITHNNDLEIQKLYQQILEFLNDSIKLTPQEYKDKQVLKSQLLDMLFSLEIPNLINHVKIIEPMFQSNYAYVHDSNILIQGYMSAFHVLSTSIPANQLCSNLKNICMNHTNKYVRKTIVDLAVDLLMQRWDDQDFEVILQALNDESTEVRKAAFRFYHALPQQYISLVQKKSSIGILVNCHMENLMEESVKVCQQLYLSEGNNPILGIATYVKEQCLSEAIRYLYENSISRYYQIRCSSLYTLQSIIILTKEQQPLDPEQAIRIILNDALYEQDPQVRQAALKVLVQFVKYYNLSPIALNSTIGCASFHMSDIPFNCKESCSMILSQLFPKTHLIAEEIAKKIIIIKDRDQMLKDFIGEDFIDSEEIKKAIEVQGGKDRVINKHTVHLNLALALFFKFLTINQSIDTYLIVYLKQLLIEINYTLRQRYIYEDGHQEIKYQTYMVLAESLEKLKIIKRLPIQILDESEILETLALDLKNMSKLYDVIDVIGKVVGDAIIKGRLEQYQ